MTLTYTDFKIKNGLDVAQTVNIAGSLNVAQGASIGGTLTAAAFNGPITGSIFGTATSAFKWAAAMTLAHSGDATGSGAFDGSTATTIALTLKNTGSIGTYTKVITDAQGRITSGSSLLSLDVTTALSFTPYNISNPAGYITGTTISGTQIDTALGYTPVAAISASLISALGYTPVNIASLGVVSGVATLNNLGVVPNSQLPAAIVGSVQYQGTWNASANSPSLNPASASISGQYWVVSTAGTTSLSGVIGTLNSWLAGDIVIADGASWGKINGSSTEVSSVNGLTGAVSITSIIGNAGTSSKWVSTMTLATSGDATGSGAFDGSTATTIALTLKNTGSVGTYTKVITDAQGRITSGSSLLSLDVTTALSFTPYNISNPAGYITGTTISGTQIDTALGYTPVAAVPASIYSALTYTPYNQSNPAGYISGISSTIVATALGYTPVNRSGDTMSGALNISSGGVSIAGTITSSNYAMPTGIITSAPSGISVTSTSPVIIDSFATISYRAAKYVLTVDASAGSNGYQVSELLLIQDGAGNMFMTEYAQLYTGAAPVISFAASITSGTLSLTGQSVTGTIIVKFVRTSISV